jgi:16S rRNA (guanine527-N7)-methyltransferase
LQSEKLAAGLAELGIDTTPKRQAALLGYLEQLGKWNRRYNLTAVRDPARMVTRHLLDSLAVWPYLSGTRFIDVGTGAGLPGIPLAIVDPQRHFTLLDSNGKKTRFLQHVVTHLQLANVEVVHARVETFEPVTRFDAVLSRAFASLDDMIGACHHLLAAGGQFLAMKGQHPAAELAEISEDVTLIGVETLVVPGLAEERCLVRLGAGAG